MAPLPAALNAPPLVAASGAVALSVLPQLEKALLTTPFPVIKLVHLFLYALNFWAVSQPGRLDGASSVSSKDNDTNKELQQMIEQRQGRTLVAPSGWAFGIWAVRAVIVYY